MYNVLVCRQAGEHISGRYTIKQIFKNHWKNFYFQYKDRIRKDVSWNIDKVLSSREKEQLDFNTYECPDCGQKKFVPHTCKSRFCNSCGKVATDNWINETLQRLLNTYYRHLVFSPPSELWSIFLCNRKALDLLFHSAAYSFLEYCKEKYNISPGIVVVLHTFGATLNFHPHIHILITCGGLDLETYQWRRITFFHHKALKERFKYHLTNSLRALAHNDNLTLTKSIKNEWKTKHNFDSFYKLTQKLYEMKWYVWIGELFSNATTVTHYIGRYAKRPCISEASIRNYDDREITFVYKCKIEKVKKTETIPVEEFIRRMVRHIPNKQYRTIRYYGLFANRTRWANF